MWLACVVITSLRRQGFLSCREHMLEEGRFFLVDDGPACMDRCEADVLFSRRCDMGMTREGGCLRPTQERGPVPS